MTEFASRQQLPNRLGSHLKLLRHFGHVVDFRRFDRIDNRLVLGGLIAPLHGHPARGRRLRRAICASRPRVTSYRVSLTLLTPAADAAPSTTRRRACRLAGSLSSRIPRTSAASCATSL